MSRSYHSITRANFKTIKFFCQMIFKRSCSFESKFFAFCHHNRDVYFLLNLCTWKRDSVVFESIIKRTWWWSIRMMFNFFTTKNTFIFFDFITRFLRVLICSSWSSFHVYLVEITVRHTRKNCLLWENSCIFENTLFFIINRSSSMFLSRIRRRRRLFELHWNV